ncbi:cytochrome P450 [Actinophytocola sp.]|uniref:cytochrome P450 n=1 Tax=Actinophytocola sp. TaxID=1872138 RepID=UPI002D80089A|nr:cytochrome P450 [Actinophytocola sp.]HET9138671.1 cytochrome P450 [Actinophytocola sp.]
MAPKCPVHAHPMLVEDEQFWIDPNPVLARLQERGPIHRVCLPDRIPVWLVTGHDDVRAGLRDQRLARQRKYAGPDYTATAYPEGQPDGRLVMEDPPEHTATRRLINFAFTPRHVATIEPRIQEIVTMLLDRVEREAAERGAADLVRTFFAPLPVWVISGILGLHARHLDKVLAVTDAEFALAETRDEDDDTDPLGAALMTAQSELNEILSDLVRSRRAEPADDLISHWATATDDDGELLPVYDVVDLVMLLYFAGSDTTAGTLVSSTVDLMAQPTELARLRANPELFPAAVEELLRRNAPALRAVRRFAIEDMVIAGQRIAAGDTVMLSIRAANRDPAVFADAAAFDMTRPSNHRHLAFGHGPHHCPGNSLAAVEMTIALRELFLRFPGIELAVPPERIPWRRSTLIRAAYGLPVRLGVVAQAA